MTRIFFLRRSKRSRLLRGKENVEGVAALLTRVEGRSSTEDDSLWSFSLHGSEGRSSKVLVAAASSTPKQHHDSESECRRDGRGSGDVGAWRNESSRFVL